MRGSLRMRGEELNWSLTLQTGTRLKFQKKIEHSRRRPISSVLPSSEAPIALHSRAAPLGTTLSTRGSGHRDGSSSNAHQRDIRPRSRNNDLGLTERMLLLTSLGKKP